MHYNVLQHLTDSQALVEGLYQSQPQFFHGEIFKMFENFLRHQKYLSAVFLLACVIPDITTHDCDAYGGIRGDTYTTT